MIAKITSIEGGQVFAKRVNEFGDAEPIFESEYDGVNWICAEVAMGNELPLQWSELSIHDEIEVIEAGYFKMVNRK